MLFDHVITQIDKMVIDAVKHHMRNVCGDVLDKMKGENYEVTISVTLCT